MVYGILAVVVLAAFVLVIVLLQRKPYSVRTVDDLRLQSRPVDIDAFRNLTDPDEEAYLRSSLSSRDFRRVQRVRLRAAIEYVRRTAYNSALLLQLADAARRSSDSVVVKAASELAERATQLRLYSILLLALLELRVAFPGLPIRAYSFVSEYVRMRETMAGLTRMQSPAYAAQVDSVL